MDKEKMQIVIVGHVDHGKSTVIGRLLADTNALPEGKLEQIQERCKRESKVFEYAFLLDALHDEQDQGITIDSARCFFKSNKRDYIIIDAPGHIEFLKNMISGAARAEAALLVIDAEEGVQENSKRHGYMLSMLGINQVVVCVNKMDLVDYSEKVFENIKKEYSEFLEKIGIDAKEFIPVSALKGDNIVENSGKLSWFKGNNVLSSLDSFEKEKKLEDKPFRMPVQGVYKFTGKGDNRRIIAGRIESGSIKAGDSVVFLPSNKRSQIKGIEEFNSNGKESASSGHSTGFTLTEQVFVGRGDIMCKESERVPYVSNSIKANIFWMARDDLVVDRWYKLKIGTFQVPVKVNKIVDVLDASNLSGKKKESVARHEVAKCFLDCKSPLAFDLFNELQNTGRFVIVDDYDICGGGIIEGYVEMDHNVVWHERGITRDDRAKMLHHNSALVWFTGLSGSGKSTIAVELQKKLIKEGKLIYVLDGDNIRHGLNKDLGFSEDDRIENIRRIGEVANLFVDAGVITMTAFISPYQKDRNIVRNKLGKDFVEVYVKCSLEECEKRDPKGLYKKARAGEIKDFTGLNAPYEEPENPELIIETDKLSVKESVEKVYDYLKEKGIV
ncbi:adenylyl-sulfate kinase [Candidatus Woesearchaeota archaeon]|nr:adenylyl-sulfate kinase [Candidatus Woesearchaeota archaeon]